MHAHEQRLPDEIRGEWIWLRNGLEKLESYVLFRRAFTLFETPVSAELWITARTRFHLFLNGRHIAYGPPPCPTEDAYVTHVDASFLCETGNNSIAVLAHNTQVSRFGARRHESGLWVQLNIDDAPFVWTDESWLCREAAAYAPNRPRISEAAGFTEEIDFRRHPVGWESRDFSPEDWVAPDHRRSLGNAKGKLVPIAAPPRELVVEPAKTLACRGTWSRSMAVTFITFAELVGDRGGGVYAAQSHVFSPRGATLPVEVYCDDPYALFVNGDCRKTRGIRPLPPEADLELCRPRCFRQSGKASPEGEIVLREGWNRILIAQQVEPGSAGVFLAFPESRQKELTFVRKQDQTNLLGWSLVGPLRTPLALFTGNIDLSSLARVSYVPTADTRVDESVFLHACSFHPVVDLPLPAERVELRVREYAIWDLGRTVYGCPQVQLDGTEGDVIDIVCSEHYIDGRILSLNDGRKHTDTVVLGSADLPWRGCAPRGFRYVMLAVRQAAANVAVRECGVAALQFQFDSPGAFECSDEGLNRIWRTGERTLRATVQEHFLDSPSKDQTQYITDSMIQSWAAYHVFGAFGLARKALEEFSQVQFETGEMSAVCPSDIFVHMPDYSLMWPMWLRRHYLYTGDLRFLESMSGPLEKLLEYYHQLTVPGWEVLENLHTRCGAYCFLDHGEMDREGMVTGLNALYCRALLCGAWLCEQLQRTEQAEEYRARASRTAERVREVTWDGERGLFADGWSRPRREMSEFYSWQTSVLAIYGGIAPPETYAAIIDSLFVDDVPFELFASGDADSPFFKYFVLESAFALGKREWALRLLKWYWGRMCDRGAETWWELFDPQSQPDEIPNCSLCHGYGTSPNAFLCTELVGVRPAAPGSTRIFFDPLASAVQWVKARIPTPHGHIDVEWRRNETGQFEALIDANYPLEVIPRLAAELADEATIRLGDEVSILAEVEDEAPEPGAGNESR